MKILIVFLKQKSVYCLQSKRRSLNICNDSSPRENIMNSLPSSYSGSYLGKIAARSSGLENRVDLEKYTQGWEGSVNGIAISSIAVLWFFVQHPLPSHFLRGGGGGELGVSLHLQDRLWRGIWGLEKIVQQVKHHQNPSTPPPSPLGSQRNFDSVLTPPLLWVLRVSWLSNAKFTQICHSWGLISRTQK